MVKTLPKAELHVHLEGTLSPDMVRSLAQKNKISLPDTLFDKNGQYTWQDDGSAAASLTGFLSAYDEATKVISCAQDYTDISYDYLKNSAAENVIYVEFIISADHGKIVGLSYPEMVDAIAKGIQKAQKDFTIEARMLSSCVRHYGPQSALNVAQQTVEYPHPLVTGFTMAGDENAYEVIDFKPAFDLAKKSGLQVTAHAGEAAGPQSIRKVRDLLGCTRFGHMVRIIEDDALMSEMAHQNITPEVCVSSNLVLHVYPNYQSHPIKKLWQAGFNVTLGSDDPPFFFTSIGREYEIAQQEFGFTNHDLLQMTQNAIKAAFIDDKTRHKLEQKITLFSNAI